MPCLVHHLLISQHFCRRIQASVFRSSTLCLSLSLKAILDRGEGPSVFRSNMELLEDTVRCIFAEMDRIAAKEKADADAAVVREAIKKLGGASRTSDSGSPAARKQQGRRVSGGGSEASQARRRNGSEAGAAAERYDLHVGIQTADAAAAAMQGTARSCLQLPPSVRPFEPADAASLAGIALGCWQAGSGGGRLAGLGRAPLGEVCRSATATLAALAAADQETAALIVAAAADRTALGSSHPHLGAGDSDIACDPIAALLELSGVVETDCCKRAGDIKAAACAAVAMLSSYDGGGAIGTAKSAADSGEETEEGPGLCRCGGFSLTCITSSATVTVTVPSCASPLRALQYAHSRVPLTLQGRVGGSRRVQRPAQGRAGVAARAAMRRCGAAGGRASVEGHLINSLLNPNPRSPSP